MQQPEGITKEEITGRIGPAESEDEVVLGAWRRFLEHLKPHEDPIEASGGNGALSGGAEAHQTRVLMYKAALEWLATRISIEEWLQLVPGEAALEAFLPAIERAFAHHHAPTVQKTLVDMCDDFDRA